MRLRRRPRPAGAHDPTPIPDPQPGACPTCARFHEPHIPHDRDSLYYQIRFEAEHGWAPTWNDAWAHCTPPMRILFRIELNRIRATHGLPPINEHGIVIHDAD